MAYRDFKGLLRRATFGKVLCDKGFNIDQRRIASMAFKYFDKKSWSTSTSGDAIIQNQQLAEELYRPIVRKYETNMYNM